jgi:uncharacterized membrane protein YdjX (TVP38/TMEM64 family)
LIGKIKTTVKLTNTIQRISVYIGIITVYIFVSSIYFLISNYFTGGHEFLNITLNHDFTVFCFVFGGIIIQTLIPGYPQELLFIYSGMEFGILKGGLINWTAMVIAAQLSYEIARLSVTRGKHLRIISILNENSNKLQFIQNRGNFGLFVIRLIPFAPNDGLSYLAGTLNLPRKNYFFVSMVTFLPYAFLYSYAGSKNIDFINKSVLLEINIILLVLLISIGIIIKLKRSLRT